VPPQVLGKEEERGHEAIVLRDGLVVIGGDDSNTNACLLAEYFAKKNSKFCVS
jgi:6-phosphofructokinase